MDKQPVRLYYIFEHLVISLILTYLLLLFSHYIPLSNQSLFDYLLMSYFSFLCVILILMSYPRPHVSSSSSFSCLILILLILMSYPHPYVSFLIFILILMSYPHSSCAILILMSHSYVLSPYSSSSSSSCLISSFSCSCLATSSAKSFGIL